MKLKKLLTILLLGPLFPLINIDGDKNGEKKQNDDDQNKDDQNDNDDQNKDDDQNKEGKQEVPKTYSQADIDKIIENRLRRERKTWKKQVDDERLKAQMSVEDRLKKEKEDAENKANDAIVKANSRLIKSDIITKAGALGVIDTDAVYKLIDKEDIDIDENGNISGVEEAIKALITNKPYLVKKQQSSTDNDNKSGDDQQSNNTKKKSVSLNDLIRKATGR